MTSWGISQYSRYISKREGGGSSATVGKSIISSLSARSLRQLKNSLRRDAVREEADDAE